VTTKPTAAELAEAQATLDVHNAANGTHLKIEQPDPWEIQGFIDGYGDGRAAWSTGVDGTAGVLTFLANALDDTAATAFLIRRPTGGDVEHVRLIDGDARKRLARHLYLDAAEPLWRRTRSWAWDHDTDEGGREPWLAKADAILAVIAGRER
jgi:hypothetical protein